MGGRVERERGYGNVTQTEDEGVLIDENGMLQIDWPGVDAGEPVDLDLLLVTSNDPTLRTPLSYPAVETIVNAWNGAAPEHAEYSGKTDHGISTFQDDEIRAGLHPRQQGGA